VLSTENQVFMETMLFFESSGLAELFYCGEGILYSENQVFMETMLFEMLPL